MTFGLIVSHFSSLRSGIVVKLVSTSWNGRIEGGMIKKTMEYGRSRNEVRKVGRRL